MKKKIFFTSVDFFWSTENIDCFPIKLLLFSFYTTGVLMFRIVWETYFELGEKKNFFLQVSFISIVPEY